MKIQIKFLQENSGSYYLYNHFGKLMLKAISFEATVEFARCLPAICGASALGIPASIEGNGRVYAATPYMFSDSFRVLLRRIA